MSDIHTIRQNQMPEEMRYLMKTCLRNSWDGHSPKKPKPKPRHASHEANSFAACLGFIVRSCGQMASHLGNVSLSKKTTMHIPLKAIALASLNLGLAQSSYAQSTPTYPMLVDRLDRPHDGYCVDVLGSGSVFRTDLPLNTHNCKPGIAPDGVIAMRADGTLHMPAFDLCITAHGVNRTSLAGAALILMECGVDTPFFAAIGLQTWDLTNDGLVNLRGSNLCLAAGLTSSTTFSRFDTWRSLSMQPCDDTPLEQIRWEFSPRS